MQHFAHTLNSPVATCSVGLGRVGSGLEPDETGRLSQEKRTHGQKLYSDLKIT
jgi:hypothetical protein